MSDGDASDVEAADEETPDTGPGGAADLEDIAAEPAGDADAFLAEIAAEAVEANGEADADPRNEAFEPGDIEVGEDLVERVAETDDEAIARELATLQLRIAALEGETEELLAEVEDLEGRLKRKQADFQNYKKRQQERLAQEKERATEDLVERLLDVRDNLVRALDQDEDADIRGGLETTLNQFDQELERENVAVIEPEPGESTDPVRHEVLLRVDADQPADTIASVERLGYEMGDTVLRPAQVTVSDGPADAADED
jgi:molecular chaperone GrpE